MFKILTVVIRLLAIAIGTTLATIYRLPLNIQANQTKKNSFTKEKKYI